MAAYLDPNSESRNERAERLKTAAAVTNGTAQNGGAANNAADVPA